MVSSCSTWFGNLCLIIYLIWTIWLIPYPQHPTASHSILQHPNVETHLCSTSSSSAKSCSYSSIYHHFEDIKDRYLYPSQFLYMEMCIFTFFQLCVIVSYVVDFQINLYMLVSFFFIFFGLVDWCISLGAQLFIFYLNSCFNWLCNCIGV